MKDYIKKLIRQHGLRLSLLFIAILVCLNALLVIYYRNLILKNSELSQQIQLVRDGLNITEKNGNLAKLLSVVGDEDLIITTTKGMIIRVPVEQIATSKRSTQGVRLIKLNDGHSVATIAIVPKAEEIEELDEIGQAITPIIEGSTEVEVEVKTEEVADKTEE